MQVKLFGLSIVSIENCKFGATVLIFLAFSTRVEKLVFLLHRTGCSILIRFVRLCLKYMIKIIILPNWIFFHGLLKITRPYSVGSYDER
jgi:hypothetical protein